LLTAPLPQTPTEITLQLLKEGHACAKIPYNEAYRGLEVKFYTFFTSAFKTDGWSNTSSEAPLTIRWETK
jgi:hypothetical protein